MSDILDDLREPEWRGPMQHCRAWTELDALQDRAAAEIARLRAACSATNEAVCQTLGRTLGYPKFCDDQENFPGATEADGVCVGDHVAESIAEEAARKIGELRAAEAAAFRRGVEAKKVQIMNLIGNKGERPNPHRDPYPCGWWDARDWHFTAIAALPPPEDKG